MIIIKLFTMFFKIGLFSFGGGYAMIPVIQREIEKYGWITPSEFVDIIGVAGMTPGPIAVNLATFIGFRATGFWGAFFSSLGIMMPSFICVLLLSKYFNQFREHPLNILIFDGIKAVVVGLIASAAISISKTSLLIDFNLPNYYNRFIMNPFKAIHISGFIIMIFGLFLLLKKKVHPILVIFISAILGMLWGQIS